MIYYIDTETLGFHGLPVLLQYAKDSGPIQLWNIWNERIDSTLELIEEICDADVCGFNLAFDWFHLCKLYTTLMLCPDKSVYPEDMVDEIGILEERARFSDLCLKPRRALDLMLHARRGPYQSLMERDDIKIRRVPTPIAWHLTRELERRIQLDEIYFSRAKDPLAPRWKIYDILRPDGTINPDFKDIKLKFKASGSLKNLYRHAFQVKEKIFYFRDVEVNRKFLPKEVGYAPFAKALAPDFETTGDWNGTWPEVVKYHTLHWYYNEDARKYASDDVMMTRRLHVEHFNSVEPGDKDSTLACLVAACRWRGYAVDLEKIKNLKQNAIHRAAAAPRDHRAVKRYISQVLDESEKAAIQGSTKKVILEEMADGPDWVLENGERHPASIRAKAVLSARKAEKEIEVYDKLLRAKRAHFSFKVTGALSNRMSGDNGLNPQGINHETFFRSAFPLADNDSSLFPNWMTEDQKHVMHLCGGDFKGFEVTIALRVFDEPKLTDRVKSGIKVHGIMGTKLFPGKTYDDILKSEGTAFDMYDKGKKGFFLKVYFGNAYTFHTKLGIPMDIAEKADIDFNQEFPGVKRFQDGIHKSFGALQQLGGIGSRVEWHEPLQFSESFLGFKRYFTLEIMIARTLFQIAQDPPPSLKNVKIKVVRRERVQTAGGATQSALYAAAFGIASAMTRAAGNHKVQNPGAEITKALQENLWKLQPVGPNPWVVQPMNVHDEVMCPTKPGFEKAAEDKANETVAEYRKHVPLLAIDWFSNIPNWANKKGTKDAGENSHGRLQSVA